MVFVEGQSGPFDVSPFFLQALWLTLKRDPGAEKAQATLDREVSRPVSVFNVHR